MDSLEIPSNRASLQRRAAVRTRSPNPAGKPRGPRPCPPSRKSTRLNVVSLPPPRDPSSSKAASRPLSSNIPSDSDNTQGMDEHRLSFASTSSSSSSSPSFDMPVTPPPIICDLPIQTIPAKPYPSPTASPSYHPASRKISIRRDYSIASSSNSWYSQPSPIDEMYDTERVRLTRLRMAQDLLARRRLERKFSSESLWSIETADWQREVDFTDWQSREVEAMAKERKLQWDKEKQRGFREWERQKTRERAKSWIAAGGASLSRR